MMWHWCVLIGSFRALSPLHTDSHNTTQHGDHDRQDEISQSLHVSSRLQQSFCDRGDHVFEEAVREYQSTKAVTNVNLVDHMSQTGVSILPVGNGSTYSDIELTNKPKQPQINDSSSDPAAKSCSICESGDAGQSQTDVTTFSQTMQYLLPTSVSSSTEKRLNWETLFMPYRRKVDAAQTEQSVPVGVVEETKIQKPTNLVTLREGFSESIVTRHYSEGDVITPDYADNTLVDNTSLWVMTCDISETVYKVYLA